MSIIGPTPTPSLKGIFESAEILAHIANLYIGNNNSIDTSESNNSGSEILKLAKIFSDLNDK